MGKLWCCGVVYLSISNYIYIYLNYIYICLYLTIPNYRRLADHFTGKQHMTFQKIRDVMDEIRARKATRSSRNQGQGQGGGGSQGEGRVRGYSRDRGDRDRDRDRDGGGGRVRDRGDRGDRGGDRERDRDRGNNRESTRDSHPNPIKKVVVDFPFYYSDLDLYSNHHAVTPAALATGINSSTSTSTTDTDTVTTNTLPSTNPDHNPLLQSLPVGVSVKALETIRTVMTIHNDGRHGGGSGSNSRKRSRSRSVDRPIVEYDSIIDWTGTANGGRVRGEAPRPGFDRVSGSGSGSSNSKKYSHSHSHSKSSSSSSGGSSSSSSSSNSGGGSKNKSRRQ